MRIALVRDGIAENVIVAPSILALQAAKFADLVDGAEIVDVTDLAVGPGWQYADGEWTDPEED